jgi:hypothetical protein
MLTHTHILKVHQINPYVKLPYQNVLEVGIIGKVGGQRDGISETFHVVRPFTARQYIYIYIYIYRCMCIFVCKKGYPASYFT